MAYHHKKQLIGIGTGFVLAFGHSAWAQTKASDTDVFQDIIVVYGQKHNNTKQETIQLEQEHLSGPDTARLIARLPGASINTSGRLSSQVQYRGLFGARINVRIDQEPVAPGGPGWMDPPLHYAPMVLVRRIEVDRGISPVSAGPGLGGGVNAVLKRTDFTNASDFQGMFDLGIAASSNDSGYSFGGIAGVANEHMRLNALYSLEDGDDLRFPGGTINGTSYHRLQYGLSTGVRSGEHTLELTIRKQETGDSGNPPFPMDIHYFDSEFANLNYEGVVSGMNIQAKLGLADISHGMSNFRLRLAPEPARQRETFAKSFRRTVKLSASFDLAGGQMNLGLDTDFIKNKSRITNPKNAGFYLDNVPIITRRRTGGFVEWTGAAGAITAELGARIDRYSFGSDKAGVGPATPAMPTKLARMYNASDRNFSETNSDFVARMWGNISPSVIIRATLARKSRAPNYLDRFAWLPTTASAGLADGNIYLGNPDIHSEHAWIANIGFDYNTPAVYFRPSIYIRSIDGYIQGVDFDNTVGVIDSPQEMVARMNGDATPLKFANVDANIYGFDADFGILLAKTASGGRLRLDGVASFVRGKRRDIDDNLYRISPPNMTLTTSYETQNWSLGLEGKFVAAQNDISTTNSEQATPGYSVFGIYGNWHLNEKVTFGTGIENVLNTKYSQHLAGYNRNRGGDIPFGARLPGSGRGFFVKISLRN